MRRVRMADLLPGEATEFLSVGSVGAEVARRLVCAVPSESIHMTRSLWRRVLAKHNEFGRMLTDEELREAVQAESGVDHDA